MRKFLLFIAVMPLFSFSQTVVWSDNFNDEDISDWTLVDADGDGNNWSAVQIQDQDGNPVGTPVLRSASWSTNALTPDNWAISPVIDLSSFSSGDAIAFNWEVMAIDADWDVENYTVYVASGNSIDELLASTTTFNEATLDGVNSLTPRTLDISSFAGQSAVYVAFRHHDVTDQFTIEIDNVSVQGPTLGVEDVNSNTSISTLYPNPVGDSFQVNLAEGFNLEKTVISISDMNGKVVAEMPYADAMNVSNLVEGVYIVTISDGEHSENQKMIKK